MNISFADLFRGEMLEEFDFVTKKIENVYSYLKYKQKVYKFDYDKLKSNYRTILKNVDGKNKYEEVLVAFFNSFHDGHLRIKFRKPYTKNTGPSNSSVEIKFLRNNI